MENWRDIPEWEGYYQVSDMGRVRSLERKVEVKYKNGTSCVRPIKERILKLTPDGDNYLHVGLHSIEGKKLTKKVHRLVLEAFSGSHPEDCEACHYDGCTTNNRLDNLRWDTHKNNSEDSRIHGTMCRGEKMNFSKLKNGKVGLIKKLLNKGVKSVLIEKMFKISRQTISSIKNNRTWKHIEPLK